jgi:hypothetical protein
MCLVEGRIFRHIKERKDMKERHDDDQPILNESQAASGA